MNITGTFNYTQGCGPVLRRIAGQGVNGGGAPDASRAQAASDRVASVSAQKLCQTACKPGSVPSEDGDDHSSGPPVAGRFSRPTRTPRAVNPAAETARHPYSVLLQAGLAMPSLLPGTRWALTPPFHPYRPREAGGLLSVALSLGSPRAGVTRRLFTVEPGLSSLLRRGSGAQALRSFSEAARPPGRLTGARWAFRRTASNFSLPFMGRDGEAQPSPGGERRPQAPS